MNNRLVKKWQDLIILGSDVLAIIFSILVSYLLRFDFSFPSEYLHSAIIAVAIAIPIKIIIFYFFGLYRGMFRYTSLWDMINILKASRFIPS